MITPTDARWIVKVLEKEIEVLRDAVMSGRLDNYSEIRYTIGKAKGIQQAQNIITELAKQQAQDDDEDLDEL